MIKNISNLGDAALYCDFGDEVNKSINSQVIKYFKTIKEQKPVGINNLTPSYNKLIISYDLKQTNFNEVKKNIENLNVETSLKLNTNTFIRSWRTCICMDVSMYVQDIIFESM